MGANVGGMNTCFKCGHDLGAVLSGVVMQKVAGLGSALKQFTKCAAWLHDLPRQSVHLDVEIIANHDLFRRIEHY